MADGVRRGRGPVTYRLGAAVEKKERKKEGGEEEEEEKKHILNYNALKGRVSGDTLWGGEVRTVQLLLKKRRRRGGTEKHHALKGRRKKG